MTKKPEIIESEVPSDEALCLLAASGDSEAAEALVLRCQAMVRRFCRPLFLMGGDQEDLVQEGMLALTLAMRSYRPESGVPFQGFAARCVHNRLVSAIRDASSSRHLPLNSALSLEDTPAADQTDALGDPEALVMQDERFAQLRASLTALENQVLQLYLQGHSYGTICQRLGRSAKSVDNALQRIRRKCSAQ